MVTARRERGNTNAKIYVLGPGAPRVTSDIPLWVFRRRQNKWPPPGKCSGCEVGEWSMMGGSCDGARWRGEEEAEMEIIELAITLLWSTD